MEAVAATSEISQLIEAVSPSMEEVARQLGCDLSTLYRWKNGRSKPRLSAIRFLRSLAGKETSSSVRPARFTFIDLFSGIGGMRMGVEAVGGRCIFSCEWTLCAENLPRELPRWRRSSIPRRHMGCAAGRHPATRSAGRWLSVSAVFDRRCFKKEFTGAAARLRRRGAGQSVLPHPRYPGRTSPRCVFAGEREKPERSRQGQHLSHDNAGSGG